ncbi:hypothetical protein MJO28_011464 [Puccinia striiformis f. sp. tritici]|uniref:Uncharacterized protein n=1 Tax=Puccinia striiformis f. sp. tritici TaxID=168172 RepID=A0ACC0E3G8_9BASI|nr:hypothetical protein MJO28_011464 [Puccinia striiformis f. sp. tritici]
MGSELGTLNEASNHRVLSRSTKLLAFHSRVPPLATSHVLYSNHATWINRAQRRVGLKKGTTINPTELHRVSSHQARATGAALRHSTSVA